MSTYVLMRIFESSANRYDWGIRFLTFGKLDALYDELTAYVGKGQTVLDVGCGTGALTCRAARKGAFVKGIDINPEMLEIGRKRVEAENLIDRVVLSEMGIAELDSEPAESFDIVMSGLCFSELTEAELAFALKHIRRILKTNGLLLVADEIIPGNWLKRILLRMVRLPVVVLTYLLTQTSTHPLKNFADQIESNGFLIETSKRNFAGDFIGIIARKT